jgi:DNA repair protein RecO (recombination protein O)
MPLIQTEAITLRRRRIHEADALITLFTKDKGKITVAVRSVAKTSSRYAGVSQPFNHLHVVLYAKTELHDIWTLTQSALIEQYQNLQTNVKHIAAASCIAEWVDGLSTDFHSALPVWNLLKQAFSRWNQSPPTIEDVLYYQWHLMLDAGVLPDVSQCMQCKKTESVHWMFHPKEGGIFCDHCSHEGLPVQPGSLQVIRLLLNNDKPPSVRLSGNQQREITLLMKKHLEFHADFSPTTNLFWDQPMNQQNMAAVK